VAPPAEAAEPTAPATSDSLLAPVGRALLDFQREANRTIAQQMRAIRNGQTTAPLLLGLLLAFAYGAIHAAGPDHGKLVVMSYFLSRDARVGRGLLMGAQIAVMHVLSAIAVVVFADLLLRKGFGGAPSEVPAVRIVSYGLILAIGLAMLWRAVRRARAATHHHHDHACGCGARHDEGGLLSFGVGLVPCTGSVLILLYAMANGILMAGLALVVMIALGMAVTMGALGLVSVVARRFVAERLADGAGRVTLAVDVAGSLAIVLLGAGLLLTAV
jgi:ABC-type nickel/cobalt efflux system permease component RcnA